MGDYSGERFDPTLPRCLNVTLFFDGKELRLTGSEKTFKYHAVSGRPLPNGKFIYTYARQTMSDIGPIPEGIYWINPSEMWTNSWHKIAPRASWGNHRITIHPFTTTETYGRGGFFIHGGDIPGSAGCIDLTDDMDRFTDDLLREVGAGQNCQLRLEVNYSPLGDFPIPRGPTRLA